MKTVAKPVETEGSREEYRALVVQVASWCMRREASRYEPVSQTLAQFVSDVQREAT